MVLLLVDDLLEGRSIIGGEPCLLKSIVVIGGNDSLVEVELEVLEDESAGNRRSSIFGLLGREMRKLTN